jgi:hypothetical protein
MAHPASLERPEEISQFVLGKRLLTFPDCSARAPRNSSGHLGVWYRLVVNEAVTGRRLHSNDTWTGQAHIRSVIASTTQLQLGNGRDGYLSRVLTLPTLPRRGEKDPALREKLLGNAEAHRRLRGEILGWALAMPMAEVNAVLDRNDPHGILRDTAADLAREADPPSRWADLALVPHPLGPQTPVEDQQWQEMFDCYLAWCQRVNIKHEGTRDQFVGQIRTLLGPARCLRRCKGPRPERLNLPRMDAGFALRPNLIGTGNFTGGTHFNLGLLKEGGLDAIAKLDPVVRPDSPVAPQAPAPLSLSPPPSPS